jgi:hypothetical protein
LIVDFGLRIEDLTTGNDPSSIPESCIFLHIYLI